MMKTVRSPRYPSVSLPVAIERAAKIYKADHRNKIPKTVVAKHMGYGSLNGASLAVISALSKYGLLDGRHESMWVSDRAVEILVREQHDPERLAALKAAARGPELFKEIDDAFPSKASDAAIRSFLITKQKFLPDSAEKLIRAYRETKDFVEAALNGLVETSDVSKPDVEPHAGAEVKAAQIYPAPLDRSTPSKGIMNNEVEWIRGVLSKQTRIRLLVTGMMGPREIANLIKLLQAQREILVEDEEAGLGTDASFSEG